MGMVSTMASTMVSTTSFLLLLLLLHAHSLCCKLYTPELQSWISSGPTSVPTMLDLPPCTMYSH